MPSDLHLYYSPTTVTVIIDLYTMAGICRYLGGDNVFVYEHCVVNQFHSISLHYLSSMLRARGLGIGRFFPRTYILTSS